MYKSGEIASSLGLTSKTVLKWTEMFEDFFSDSARGVGKLQRSYTDQDRLVLNTIRVERARNADWEHIRARLTSGDLEQQLPPQAATVTGENAIAVYTQLRMLESQLEIERRESERSRREFGEREERYREDIQSKDKRIEELSREVGKWQALYEILREQVDDEEA